MTVIQTSLWGSDLGEVEREPSESEPQEDGDTLVSEQCTRDEASPGLTRSLLQEASASSVDGGWAKACSGVSAGL